MLVKRYGKVVEKGNPDVLVKIAEKDLVLLENTLMTVKGINRDNVDDDPHSPSSLINGIIEGAINGCSRK